MSEAYKQAGVDEPSGYGVDIYEPFEPSPIMKRVQQLGEVPDKEVYQVFNMGQGMVVATPYPERVGFVAGCWGMESKVIGEATAQPGVRIRSAGVQKPGQTLVYER